MDAITNGILSLKMLEVCGSGIDASVYAFLPTIESKDIRHVHTHNLYSLTTISGATAG